MKTLYQRLVEVMKPEEIDHHSSDLYVKITKESTRIIDEYYNEGGNKVKLILKLIGWCILAPVAIAVGMLQWVLKSYK